MKTFSEFLEEAYYKSSEALLAAHGGKLPEGKIKGYRPRGDSGVWFLTTPEAEKASKAKSKARREERKNPLTTKDFESYAKRNLIKNPREFAAITKHREDRAIAQKETQTKSRQERTGIPQHLDHIQPLSQNQRRPENQERFYKITPAHSAKNLETRTAKSNEKKGDTPPKRGEPGSKLTRAGAIRHTVNDTKEFIKNLDSAIGNVQGKPAKRMAKAYDRITGLSSEKPKPKKQTSNSSTSRVPPPRKIGSRNVPPPIRK
jgi:hypothetical protein